MAKQEVQQVRLVGLNECATLIRRTGHLNTVVLQSEPGCGKSSILTLIAETNGDKWRRVGEYFPDDKYQYIYVDSPTLMYGDTHAYIPDRETKSMEEFAGAMFSLGDPRPKVIMFDEVLKLPKSMKPIVTRVMRERTVGNRPFPKGTIVFGTSNNMRDNVGDTTHAHEGNRLTFVNMRKPNVNEMLTYASRKGWNETMMAWIKMEPGILDSYMTLSQEQVNSNPYIYNPYKPQVTFCSPRSLEIAQHYLNDRSILGDDVVLASIEGTLGTAAAHSLSTFMIMEREVVKTEDIVADPMGAPIPTNKIVLLMTLFRSARHLTSQDDLGEYQRWVMRIKERELQAVWNGFVCQSEFTARWAARNALLREWREKNIELIK